MSEPAAANPCQGERREAAPSAAFDALRELKERGYNVLIDMTAVDYLAQGREPRFEVVYRLMKLDLSSGEDRGRVELHVKVPEGAPVLRSCLSLWPIADWLEREVWDMFGIGFVDRPKIRRLLMYEEFKGHPLRKDYPIAKRQPLIGPASGERPDNPSFNTVRPAVKYE